MQASVKTPLLIQGGTVVNDDYSFPADVYIENGIIKVIGKCLDIPNNAKIIDATDKLVLPDRNEIFGTVDIACGTPHITQFHLKLSCSYKNAENCEKVTQLTDLLRGVSLVLHMLTRNTSGIDPHTHMQLPYYGSTSADDFYTGTRAALAGGTTMIIDYALDFIGVPLLESYNKWRGWADGHVCCDYGLHVGVTSWSDQVSTDMEVLAKEKGINSFKAFRNFKEFYMAEDGEMYGIFNKCRELRALGMIYPGNGHLIEKRAQELFDMGITGPEGHVLSHTPEISAEGIRRGITIAGLVNCPVMVVHIMNREMAEEVAMARRKGNVVFGEPVVAAIGTDGSHYWNEDWKHAAAYVMDPPISPDSTTGDFLLDLLANGTLQTTGTDHVPFNTDQKALGKDDFRLIPQGCNGVEDRMSVIWEKGVHTGKMDPCRFVAVTSTNAAKIYNIYPQKGRIAVGSDADVVVWDPNRTRTISVKTHHQACDSNIFEGMVCHGVPVQVVSNGALVVDNGEVNVTEGAGRFIPLPCNSEYVYNCIRKREKLHKPKKVERKPYDGPVINLDKAAVPRKQDAPKSLKKASAN